VETTPPLEDEEATHTSTNESGGSSELSSPSTGEIDRAKEVIAEKKGVIPPASFEESPGSRVGDVAVSSPACEGKSSP
jgi:hypothetical protein